MAEFLDLESAEDRRCNTMAKDNSSSSESSSRSEVEDSEGELSDELPMFTSGQRGRRRLIFPEDGVTRDNPNKRRKSSSNSNPSRSSSGSTASKCSSNTGSKSSSSTKSSVSKTSSSTKSSASKSSTLGANKSSSSKSLTPSSGEPQLPYEELLKEMKQSNELLSTLVSRADSTEDRLKLVEEKLEEFGETNSTPKSRHQSRKRSVPDEVRRETRRVYTLLLDEDVDGFPGWKIEPGVTFKDAENQSVLDRLVREVKALNSVFLTQHIKDAAYRFYRSRCEASSCKRRGKHQDKNKTKRKHERVMRKYYDRRAMIEKGKYKSDAEKEEWLKVMTVELMSSEESDFDNDDEVIVVHPLPWLSDKVINFKQTLDLEIKKDKTPQARRQMKQRSVGTASARPPKHGLPSWVLNKE